MNSNKLSAVIVLHTFVILLLMVDARRGGSRRGSGKVAISENEDDDIKVGDHNKKARDGKLLSLFQVVTFRNGPCSGATTRNGTCYTSEECHSKGGSTSGTCAGGFGVCCIFSLACGAMTSDNCTYLVNTGNDATTPCSYTICKCSHDVCRIRLDFLTFDITGPITGTATETNADVVSRNGGGIGDCATDSFGVTAPGNIGSPIICGFNTGQHMILDASDECNVATFDIGGSEGRMWDIKVTQYRCGDENGGPDGCLQWFTADTGTIASYNFEPAATVPADATHLSEQCYTFCFRQNVNKCGICFQPVVLGVIAISSGSFGLSSPIGSANGRGEIDQRCLTDYVQIPGAYSLVTGIDFVSGTPADGVPIRQRICGRFFSAEGAIGDRIDNDEQICTNSSPYRVVFKSDQDEVAGDATALDVNGDEIGAQANEQSQLPGGIIGFNLNYVLQDC